MALEGIYELFVEDIPSLSFVVVFGGALVACSVRLEGYKADIEDASNQRGVNMEEVEGRTKVWLIL